MINRPLKRQRFREVQTGLENTNFVSSNQAGCMIMFFVYIGEGFLYNLRCEEINRRKGRVKIKWTESFGENLALVVSAEPWVRYSFVVIVVDVFSSQNAWELDLVQLFYVQKVHLLQFAHSFHQFPVLIHCLRMLLDLLNEALGFRRLPLGQVEGFAQQGGAV